MNIKKIKFNTKILVFLVLLTTLTPIAFAGWLDFFKGDMTGKVTNTNGSYAVSLTMGNTPPNITFVSAIPNVGLTGDTTTAVTFFFTGYDANGEGDLVDGTSRAIFSKAGETTRSTFCTRQNTINGYSANYTCTVTMWYYDQGTNWNINVSINDSSDGMAYNDTTTFNINSLLSANITPNNLSWAQLSTGQSNATAQNTINITNTGNQNITNLTIKAFDLIGQTGAAIGWTIPAGNFSASNDTTTRCLITNQLTNQTEVPFNATSGRYGTTNVIRPIYYCIPSVPNVGGGTYNTTNQWITKITG